MELQPQREGDMAIMALAQQKYTSNWDIISVQYIFMKIGVVHLNDICIVDGRKMYRAFYSTSVNPIRRNTYNRPIKHIFNSIDITVWRQFF